MIVRIASVVVLAWASHGACAQPSVPPSRAAELMQLQFQSRATRPPPESMDGPRATAIYKRFSAPDAHGGPAQGAVASPAGSGPS